GRIGQSLGLKPPGEGLQRIVLAHPLLFLVARAVLAIDVADVVAVIAVGLALDKRRPLAAARAVDEPPHRGVDRLHILTVHALGVDAQRTRAREDVAGDGLAARRVLAVEIVLAYVDDRQFPERGHVHRFVEESLAERPVAEEAHGDLTAPAHLRGERGAGRDAGRAPDDGVGAEVTRLGIGDVHRAALASTLA